MGIMAMIQGAKNKFKNNSPQEEVESYRSKLVAGDVEVYEHKAKTIGEMISNAKTKFKTTKARVEMAQEEHRIKQNVKLKSEYENLKLKNKVNKEKNKLNELKNKKVQKGLRMLTGGGNVPSATSHQGGVGFGANPFGQETNKPTEKKELINEKKGRNALGGVNPFP